MDNSNSTKELKSTFQPSSPFGPTQFEKLAEEMHGGEILMWRWLASWIDSIALGILVLASIFLNEFVNQYNPNGHSGLFYSEQDREHFLSCGYSRVFIRHRIYPWTFQSFQDMANFTQSLFYLKNINTHEIIQTLPIYLTIHCETNHPQWEWQLIYFTCIK